MEDLTTFGSSKRGSVYVININTHAVVKSIYTGHQPHGLMVDEQNGRVYVTNRNVAGRNLWGAAVLLSCSPRETPQK